MQIKNLLLALASVAFISIIGAAIYEHRVTVPVWSAAPPASLTMFQGQYGIDGSSFWMMIHPITLVLFIAALVTNWRSPRKRNILIAFIGYLVVIAVSAIYFVPEQIAIITTPYADTTDNALVSRAATWEVLSLIRLAVLIVLAIVLLIALTKPAQKATH